MPTNIRTSMLPAYFDCARRAAAKQFKKDIEAAGFTLRETAPSVGAALGTSVHAAAEYLLRHKLQHFELGNEKHAVEIAFERFTEETAPGAEWDDTTPNPNTAHFQMKRLVGAFADFAQRVTPKAVELELRADAGDGFELTGHVDLLTMEGVVRDLKTGALHRPYQAQLGGYSLLAKSAGEQVSAVAIDWIARAAKTKPPTNLNLPRSMSRPEMKSWHCKQKSQNWIKDTMRNFRLHKLLSIGFVLMLLLVVSGCQSKSNLLYAQKQIPAPPAWTMERHEPNLTDRMLKILSE